jgi:hypothetical protein
MRREDPGKTTTALRPLALSLPCPVLPCPAPTIPIWLASSSSSASSFSPYPALPYLRPSPPSLHPATVSASGMKAAGSECRQGTASRSGVPGRAMAEDGRHTIRSFLRDLLYALSSCRRGGVSSYFPMTFDGLVTESERLACSCSVLLAAHPLLLIWISPVAVPPSIASYIVPGT